MISSPIAQGNFSLYASTQILAHCSILDFSFNLLDFFLTFLFIYLFLIFLILQCALGTPTSALAAALLAILRMQYLSPCCRG